MTTSTKAHAAHAPAKPLGATAMLRADHDKVSGLFEELEKAKSPEKKKSLAKQICTELTVHVQIEEELFYPEVKEALHDKEMVPEALVEHASIKDLISQVEGRNPESDEEMFDAKMKVMSEYVKHHVNEEHEKMFPKAEKSKIDMKELGARMAALKQELLPGQPGTGPDDMPA